MITVDVNSQALHHFENTDELASWITARTERETVLFVVATLPDRSVQFFYGDPALGQTTVKDITGAGVAKQTYDDAGDALSAFLALL